MADCIPEKIIDKFFSEITEENLAEFSAKAEKAFGKDMARRVSSVVDPVFTKILKSIKTTEAERKVIMDLSDERRALLKNLDIAKGEWKDPKAKAEYAAKTVIYKKYLDNLKTGNLPIKGMLKEYSQEIKSLWAVDKYKATQKVINDSISTLSKTLINAVSTWDNSWLGRQGAITLIKSPSTWWNMAKNSMGDFYKTLKGLEPQDVLMGEVYSHPDYINGKFKKAGISFGIEEEVPIKLLERLPIIGKVFKGSDVSFIDSAIRARMGLWDIMKKADSAYKLKHPDFLEPTTYDAGLRDRGKIINSITARGKTGKILGGEPTNLLLWAPKMLKADWDILTGHTFGFGLETKGARIEAASNITKIVLVTAGITAIAQAMGAEVETDPRATDFLKIKIGDTRINTPFARGMPQLVTLFSRLATQETKSSSGIITKLNTGEYGSKTLFDVGMDFLVNKTTPPASAVISWMRGRDFMGNKPTLKSTATGFLPISVQNFLQLKEDSSTPAVLGAFLDLFGISSNTYFAQEVRWDESNAKSVTEFRKKVGEEKFREANKLFNTEFQKWFNSVKNNPKYKNETPERKQQIIINKKADLQEKVFLRYGYRYKQKKSKPLPKL